MDKTLEEIKFDAKNEAETKVVSVIMGWVKSRPHKEYCDFLTEGSYQEMDCDCGKFRAEEFIQEALNMMK